MPRGSKIGEHRGGRERATPNRRTVLAERILAIASEHPTASASEFIDVLVKDRELPADIRIAIALEFSPARGRSLVAKSSAGRQRKGKTAGEPSAPSRNAKLAGLEMLLSIARDTVTHPVQRRKAAAEAAQHFLPKKSGPKRWWNNAPIDEYGFAITPQIAAEYRDLKIKLRSLPQSHGNFTAAQEAAELRGRVEAILYRLRCPRPSLYGFDQLADDHRRLVAFARQREAKRPLSEIEDAEEARSKARLDCFAANPECAARLRLNALTDKERAFRRRAGPPLTRKDYVDLRFLRLLYSQEAPPSLDPDMDLGYLPLRDEPFAADGNLYPANSKLRPLQEGRS